MEVSPAALAAMKKIKQALDPKNILNPGKIFLEERK
jgi:glycolate oxidase